MPFGESAHLNQPRTYVRGILSCMIRMSDSVGTHSIPGLTSGDLRGYFKEFLKIM